MTGTSENSTQDQELRGHIPGALPGSDVRVKMRELSFQYLSLKAPGESTKKPQVSGTHISPQP